jgi:hypothetical protein
MAVEREFTTEPLPRPDMAPQRGPGDMPYFTPGEGTSVPKSAGGGSSSPTRRTRGLLDIQTDLKSLKFQDFGVSPAIVKDVNNPPKYNAGSNPGSRRADDLVRITKFLASANGVKFLANQSSLAQIQLDKSKSTKQQILGALKDGLFNTAKVAGSTLAQIPVAGTGTHFIRGFGGNSYLVEGGGDSDTRTGLRGFIQKVRNTLGNSDDINGAKEVLAGNPVPVTATRDGGTNFRSKASGINSLAVQTKSILGAADSPVDIIPFEIAVITPEVTDIVNSTENFIYFQAHLTSLGDNFAGNWNSTNYIGRAEPVWTYDSFDRDISFGFKLAAFNQSELLTLYKKLNFLASSTAPTYSKESGFMRGTYSRITIGDYFMDIPGFFSNIGMNWDLTYQWEIEDIDGVPKVPHVLDVECTFKPIHDFIPEVNAPFIMNREYRDTSTYAGLDLGDALRTRPGSEQLRRLGGRAGRRAVGNLARSILG